MSVQTLCSQCLKVDLQAVSIDPTRSSITVGETAQIVVSMKNNNICPIPIGEATAQITISAVYLDLGSPIAFTDPCGQWTFLGVKSTNNQHNIFFQNKGGAIPAQGPACTFQFTVKGKKATTKAVAISLSSSLSSTATTSDMDGNNQSVATEIKVTAGKSAPFPVILSEFNVKADGCKVTLKWKSAGKQVADRFDIEYSMDGVEYTKIETMAAKSPATGSSYEYTTDKGSGRAYYRIKIISKDEQSHYSKVVTVVTNCPVKKAF